jgi:NADH-quinone oxidoreductase subunit E
MGVVQGGGGRAAAIARGVVAGRAVDRTYDCGTAGDARVTTAGDARVRSAEMGESKCCTCQSARREEELGAELDAILAEHRGEKSSLIQVLHRAQQLFGYLPREVQSRIARALGLTEAEVEGVVSFYHYFTRVPRGKHTVRVCLGTACYVRGGRKIVDKMQDELGIEVGGTTEDREFSLETVRCIGACGLAPVMTIDGDVYRRVSPAKAGKLLTGYRSKEA